MNTSRTWTILLGVIALCAIGFGLVERNRRQALEAQFAATQADLELRLAMADARSNALSESPAPLPGIPADETLPVENGAGNPDAAPNRVSRGNPGTGRTNAFTQMLEDPEFARLWTNQQKGQLDGRYSALFRLLRLNPEQLDGLKALLVEKQSSHRDIMAAARAQGLDPRHNRDQMRQLMAQSNAELDESIRKLLGPQAFSQYQQYEQTIPQRTVVDQLGDRLSYTSTPLNDQQVEQLVQILRDTAPNAASAADGMGRARVRGDMSIPETAITRAASILTPAQAAALQQLRQEQQNQREINDRLRNRPPTGPTPTPAPQGRSQSGG